MRRDTALGLIAIAGVWITAGIALPLVNVLTAFSPGQLLAARGVLTALMALVLARGRVLGVDRFTYGIALVIPFASLGLFMGVRTWGASPTIVVITATPLVNFVLSKLHGLRVPNVAIIGLIAMLSGVLVATWGWSFSGPGLAWSVFGTVCNGLLYECFSRARSTPFQRCFWGSFGIGAIGMIVSIRESWGAFASQRNLLHLLGFAIIGGLLYWLANVIAFEKLPKDIASVLAQGETPAVILMAGVLTNEHLTIIQWLGVLVALAGAWYVSRNIPPLTAAQEEQSCLSSSCTESPSR